MPTSPRSSVQVAPPTDPGISARLRPYAFHGVQLEERGNQAVGDCPFCGREGKFSVATDTGLWRCFVCGSGTVAGGGNALVFIRLLHERAVAAADLAFLAEVAADRRLLRPETVAAWGVGRAADGAWLIPGYGTDGVLDQLYRRVWYDGAWRLFPTPEVWTEGKHHALHMPAARFDAVNPELLVCEGSWDGMVMDEVLYPKSPSNVVAVPGCNVWRDEWTELCRGKRVTLLYDSDHPRVHGSHESRAGWDGMRRVAKRLAGAAVSVRVVQWGPDGYDPSRPDGWDVRDHLTQRLAQPDDGTARLMLLADLLTKVGDPPAEWCIPTPSTNGRAHSTESQSCSTWAECEAAWKFAMEWRQDMGDAMAVLLAVCASTQQAGNQLFLQLVGSAGSGKTTMCDGLLVSSHCHSLEHLTGFHSGWKLPDDQKKDCSLIARINGKTLVTPEADVLMQSPRFHEIMAQQRRIFDGKSGATYKNTDQDTMHVGLRTPWIMAGTHAMMDHDQSHLGDRFLRFIIADPNEDSKRAILRSALRSERSAMLGQANGTAGSVVDGRTRLAHALTGGYVDWLRAHAEEELSRVDLSLDAEERCIDMAELSADLRARPCEDKRKVEPHETKELPTRLARQNVRLASCLAVVLNKRSVDADVLRVVRKVALDTAAGHSLNIVRWLCSPDPKAGDSRLYQETGGLSVQAISAWTAMTPDRLTKYLNFLRKIDVLDLRPIRQTAGFWVLSERVFDLFLRVMRS